MTTRPQDVTTIRRLLAPERAARHPQPAPDRPSLDAHVDGRPARVYPAPAAGRTRDDITAGVAADQAALRQARATGHVVRLGVTDRPQALRGLPTPAERAHRTRTALDRIARGEVIGGHR